MDEPARESAVIDLFWPLLRAVLFRWDAEFAHEFTLEALHKFPRLSGALVRPFVAAPPPQLARTVFGLPFRSPVGLAAGLDKNGVGLPFWPSLGFGFIEMGTVTAFPQPGNPRPRLFRLVADEAIINRMGFNNLGSEALAERFRDLKARGLWPEVPVGANIGKSKVTPNEDAVGDYVTSVKRLQGLADWFTVNVSSPNTPGLRDLQDRDSLAKLLPAVVEAARGTPVLLKLAPDLEDDAIRAATSLAKDLGVSGIVATNTTLSRPGTVPSDESGGFSGRPLWPLARQKIGVALEAGLPVVGVGGISEAAQVRELLDLGCVAVQVYSALIYKGPGLVGQIHRGLR